MKQALITGITGQDGSYLADHLLSLGYEVHTEVDLLVGDSAKARRVLGWRPTCTFAELVSEMVRADLDQLAAESPR